MRNKVPFVRPGHICDISTIAHCCSLSGVFSCCYPIPVSCLFSQSVVPFWLPGVTSLVMITTTAARTTIDFMEQSARPVENSWRGGSSRPWGTPTTPSASSVTDASELCPLVSQLASCVVHIP